MPGLDLAVVGAGPAGLGAAFCAATAGHRVAVFERDDRVGGLAGSFEVAGQRVDFGSHRLHPSTEPTIMRDLDDLLGGDLQRRRRRGRIRLEGRWVAFPLRAADLLRNMPPTFALAAARDAALSWSRTPRAETFAEHLRAGLGPAICERFYFPYARKLWGLDPGRISAAQARKRVSADSPSKLLRRVVGRRDPDAGIFYYPRRGFGQISEALTAAAVDAGAALHLRTTVEAIEPGDDGVRLRAGDRTVTARRVWSTLPVPVLARLVAPAPPTPVKEAATRLRYRGMALVYLVCDLDRYTPFDAHYLPGEATPVTRISEPKNYRDGDDPAGRTVLCAEVPCDPGDEWWEADDRDLAGVVATTLVQSDLPPPPVRSSTVVRRPRVYPVYEVGFEEHFAALDRWAAHLPGVLTFGRQGLFVHDNTHHALAMAWAAADALRPDGAFDDGVWRAARERFDQHVVED